MRGISNGECLEINKEEAVVHFPSHINGLVALDVFASADGRNNGRKPFGFLSASRNSPRPHIRALEKTIALSGNPKNVSVCVFGEEKFWVELLKGFKRVPRRNLVSYYNEKVFTEIRRGIWKGAGIFVSEAYFNPTIKALEITWYLEDTRYMKNNEKLRVDATFGITRKLP
jgi:hypothetical protein